MSYEIPQEIAYKEKIIFGLTFSQLAWAMAFSPIVLILLFKLQQSIYIRVGLALIPSGIACLFMFTKIPTKTIYFLKFIKNREFYLMDKEMKDLLQIKGINKDILETYTHKLSIIKVEPINFSIKNKQEKEITIIAFQRFINSLDFPIQIVVATETINLDYYLRLLENKVEEVTAKTNNQDYKTLFTSYKEHLYKIIKQKGLLNRNFYLIIKEQYNIGLEVQVSVVESLLKNMDLKFKRLENDELMYCLASFFNNLYEDDNKRELLDEKLDKNNQLHYNIAPKVIIDYPMDIQAGGKLHRTISVKGYPRVVEEGFLDKLVSLNGDFDISLHIEPYPIETMMIMLNRELQKQRGDLYTLKNKGIINPALEIKYEDTKKVLESLQKGNEKLFNFSLYITCKGTTEKELDLITKKVESALNSMLMIPSKEKHLMKKGLMSTIPLTRNDLNITRNITTRALSAFFPFTSQFLQIDDSGIWLGLNKNNIPIIKDLFKLYNANGVVLASSGGGKSYFTKLMISRLLLNGTKVMVVDPQSEYIDLVNRFKGELITISRTSETIINPLDLMGHDYDEKKLTLMDLFPVMIGETSEIQKATLDRALTEVYKKKQITNDPKSWNYEPPIMGDLLDKLKEMSKSATSIERETYRSLINRIEMYVTGVFSFLNKQTNINFKNRLVCFNIGDMPNQVKPTIMFLILDYVYMKMKKDIERKILVIDEAWSLLERAEDEGYVFKIVKTCRKFNLGLLLITQDVADLLRNDAGKALLNNSEYTLLLRQKPSIIDSVEKTFKLSQQEKERLLSATTGEGIIIISNEHSEIKIVASEEEHKVITTNADEKLKQERDKAREPTTEFEKPKNKELPDTGFYKKSKLKEDEIKQLLDKEYQIGGFVGLFGGRQEQYLLKPKGNQSLEHFFVIKIIEKYIKENYDVKVELYDTVKPDILFKVNNKQIGIEVETGSLYNKNRKDLLQKIKINNQNYGLGSWFFVVTDWKFKEKYQGLGVKTIVRREIPNTLKHYFEPAPNLSESKAETAKNSKIEVQNPPGNREAIV